MNKNKDKKKYCHVGECFGRWVVLKESVLVYSNAFSSRKVRKVLCQCSCEKGTVRMIRWSHLKAGNSKSCGCLTREMAGKYCWDDLTGRVFGYLIPFIPISGGEWGCKWICYCDPELGGCGDITKPILAGNLKAGTTTSCGCYFTKVNSGKNSNKWRGGVTKLHDSLRTLARTKRWKQLVLIRDNYTCRVSGVVGGNQPVHHIKPFAQILEENHITTMEEALECKELWDIRNGITLTKEWHSNASLNPNSFHRKYGTQDCSLEQFYIWFNQFKIR